MSRTAALALALAPGCRPAIGPEPAAVDWAAAGIDWDAPPAPWPERPFTAPTPTTFSLPNGLSVVLVENHRLPLVTIRVVAHEAGGRSDGDRSGLGALTADLLDEGAGTHGAFELARELERLGARLTIATTPDDTRIAVETLAETLDPTLALVADLLVRPWLAADAFDRVRSERMAALGLRADQPKAVGDLVFEALLHPDHPYGRPEEGWLDTVGALTLDDAKGFWQTRYGPGATTLVVVGDVSRASLAAALTRELGSWDVEVVPLPGVAPAPPSPPVLALVDRPGASQSVIRIGCRAPSALEGTAAERAADDVANSAVGGSFASRLNTRLREQLGYTYGITSTSWRGGWGGAWRIGSSFRTDVTVAGLREALAIVAELRDPAGEGLPAAELARTKTLLQRSLPQDFETNGGIADAFAALAGDGRPLTTWRDRPAEIGAVDAAAVAAAAARWRDLVVVVVGDREVLGDALATLGLPVVLYDAEGRPLP